MATKTPMMTTMTQEDCDADVNEEVNAAEDEYNSRTINHDIL